MPEQEGSGIYLLGRDVMSIPCLRQSALTGFAACIGTTLVHFLFTSNGSKSAKLGMMTFFGVTFPYWYIKRMELYEKEEQIQKVQKLLKETNEEDYLILDSLDFGAETFG